MSDRMMYTFSFLFFDNAGKLMVESVFPDTSFARSYKAAPSSSRSRMWCVRYVPSQPLCSPSLMPDSLLLRTVAVTGEKKREGSQSFKWKTYRMFRVALLSTIESRERSWIISQFATALVGEEAEQVAAETALARSMCLAFGASSMSCRCWWQMAIFHPRSSFLLLFCCCYTSTTDVKGVGKWASGLVGQHLKRVLKGHRSGPFDAVLAV